MYKCCICGQELQRPTLWACPQCYADYALALSVDDWPEWAKAQQRREAGRRRYATSYGLSGSEMAYAPYDRHQENQTYRKTNNVRKKPVRPNRVSADDILYSTGDEEGSAEEGRGYHQVLESMPVELRERLLQHAERKVILADALRSLPLISQRTIDAYLRGHTEQEMADTEGVSVSTIRWLLESAKERLADLLRAKIGADSGTRFIESHG